MNTVKEIVLILTLFVLILVGCESSDSPIEIEGQQVEEQIVPEDTPIPEASPTPIPTNTPIPLGEIRIESALVQSSNLVVEDLFGPGDWSNCPNSLFMKYQNVVDESVKELDSVYYGTENCKPGTSGTNFSERIYLFDTNRQAARYAEYIKEESATYLGALCCDYETQSIDLGDISYWLHRGSGVPWEWTYMVIVKDEAVILIEFTSPRRLLEEDITDLNVIVLEALNAAQYP